MFFPDSEVEEEQYYVPEYYSEDFEVYEQTYEYESINLGEKEVDEVSNEAVNTTCSKCECQAIEITSVGVLNNAKEYNDTDTYGVTIKNLKSYPFWENITYIIEKHRLDRLQAMSNVRNNFRLVSVDLHSSKMWEKYEKFRRNTNLKYKDLQGTYNLFSCSEDYKKIVSPVYKRVLNDGTEAYLFRSKLGNSWEVMQKPYYIS